MFFFEMKRNRKFLRLLLQALDLNIEPSIGSFFVPTFDTKVTETLCFFFQTNFDFLTSHF